MRLKTAQIDACQEQLIRGGFKTISPWRLWLGGDEPGEAYEAWFYYGYLGDRFVAIQKGTAGFGASSGSVGWHWNSAIILRLA